MMNVTVTPATQSGYRLPQYAQRTTAANTPECKKAVGEALDSAIQMIRESGRDFADYQFIVSFEEKK